MLKIKPKLRFPEFDGEWEEKQLSAILEIGTGKSKVQSNESGKYNILGSTGIIGKSHTYDYEGDFILTARVGHYAGKLYKHAGKVNISDNTIYLFNFINKNFIYESLNAFKLEKLVFGSGQPLIKASDLKKLKIRAPVSKEQKKIGGFFSKLDQQIELEEQKLTLLEKQKKGYMQKVFSQELRFKDENGNNYPEWEEKELGDVATIVGGGTPNTKIAEYWNGDINWFSPVEIGNDIFVNESKSKITELGLKKSSAKLLPTGTVLFTSRAGIGKTAILNSEACTNQGFQSIVPNQSMLDSYYIYSRTNQLKKYVEIVGSGSTFIEVSGVQMRKMPIMLPSITEQEKMGVFFKKIDDSLKKQSDKIGLLKERKKGFLQKMFV